MGQMLLSNMLPVVASVLGAALTGLVGVGIKWLTSKIRNDNLRAATERAGDAVTVAVAAIEQTMRPLMIEALGDGKLSEAEKEKLRAAALDAARLQLGGTYDSMAAALGLSLEEAKKFLIQRIEAQLYANKAVEAANAAIGNG